MTPTHTLFLDRRVPEHVLATFAVGGPFRPLVDLALDNRNMLDVQLRRNAGTVEKGPSWVSLYAGLSSIISIHFNTKGAQLDTHATYRALPTYDARWSLRQPIDQLGAHINRIVNFAKECIAHVMDRGQFTIEGRVHSAIAARAHTSIYRVPNREVSVGFKNTPARNEWMAPMIALFEHALETTDPPPNWWPAVKNLGTGCDFIGVDNEGRLLALEAKPANATLGIYKGPLQVALYAHLIAAWVANEPHHRQITDDMSAQRIALGLAIPGCPVDENPKVVPVLAIGDGKSSEEGLRRARVLAEALAPTQTESVLPLEIWRLDLAGEPVDIEVFE